MCKEVVEPTATLVMKVGDKVFYPYLDDSPSAAALFRMLEQRSFESMLEDQGAWRSASFPGLPFDGDEARGVAGELVLLRDGQIAICDGTAVPDAVRLAVINYRPEEEILEALGHGGVRVELWLEWSERRRISGGAFLPERTSSPKRIMRPSFPARSTRPSVNPDGENRAYLALASGLADFARPMSVSATSVPTGAFVNLHSPNSVTRSLPRFIVATTSMSTCSVRALPSSSRITSPSASRNGTSPHHEPTAAQGYLDLTNSRQNPSNILPRWVAMTPFIDS